MLLFWGLRRENETTESKRFSMMIESVCLMKNGSTVGSTTARQYQSHPLREKLCDSLSLNIINEVDVGEMVLKFKTSGCLIKICGYSCRQHTPHCLIWPV